MPWSVLMEKSISQPWQGFLGAEVEALIAFRPGFKILLYSQPVDFRGGINSLAHLVATGLKD